MEKQHKRLESPKWLLFWLLLHKPLLLGVFAIATQSWLVLCHNDSYTKLKCLVQSHSWDPLYLPQFRDSLYSATTTDSMKSLLIYDFLSSPLSSQFFFWGREGQNISLFSVLKTFRLSLNALSPSGPYFYLRWSSKPLKATLCSTKPHPHSKEKAMAPHSSTFAWRIPWMEEPGGLQSMGSRRAGHDWATSLSLFTLMQWRRKWQPTPVFLPGESQGRGSLVGCHLWGRTESDTIEAT